MAAAPGDPSRPDIPSSLLPASSPVQLPPLQPHRPQVRYDDELERLIRVAAEAGFHSTNKHATAVDYETLVIGLAYSGDAVARFLQSKRDFELRRLLDRHKLGLDSNHQGTLLRAAEETELPAADVLYSSAARQMLDLAAEIQRLVTGNSSGPLGVRHLIAAYLRRIPPSMPQTSASAASVAGGSPRLLSGLPGDSGETSAGG